MEILNGFKMGEGGVGIFPYTKFSLCSIFVARNFPHTDFSSQNTFCNPKLPPDFACLSIVLIPKQNWSSGTDNRLSAVFDVHLPPARPPRPVFVWLSSQVSGGRWGPTSAPVRGLTPFDQRTIGPYSI